MRKARHLLAAGAIAVGVAASPAAAQWWGPSDGRYIYNAPEPPYGYGRNPSPLHREDIVDRLEDHGFEDIGRPRLQGSTYMVEALSPRGMHVRLVLDAFTGRILERVAVGDPGGRVDEPDPREVPSPNRGPAGRADLGRSPYDEMPNAPRYRPGEPDDGPASRRDTARPIETSRIDSAPLARLPTEPPRPTDTRLAPENRTETRNPPRSPEPVREASRPAPSTTARGSQPGLYGVNPERPAAARAEKGEAVASRPSKPAPAPAAPKATPTAPAPTAVLPAGAAEAKPAAPPTSTAEADAPRKPVRVIEGVTPMTGVQSTPSPQNNVQGGKN
ncbi:MAG: hypothetical protein JWR08_967 [Enterovirga sp.]|nr:hypothetical protein [Enterovirga sp.]